MANFALSNSTAAGIGGTQANLTTTFKSIVMVGVGSSSALSGNPSGGAVSPYNPRRGKLYDILIGTNTTPADNVITWVLQRTTAFGSTVVTYSGALSSVSSNLSLDPADGLILAMTTANASVETSVTVAVDVWNVGINQRASYRWVAAPGSEFVYPATSSFGLDLRALSPAYTSTVTATVLFAEQ